VPVAKIIDGKAIADALRARIAAEAAKFTAASGLLPGLAVVLVGDDPASNVYVKAKSRAAGEAGIRAFDHRLSVDVSEPALLALIGALNADPGVSGILVQLPLPRQITTDRVLRAVDPNKDVDGFHPINVGLLASGQLERAFVPCTPLGSLILLKRTLGNLAGADAVVVGRSNIVGRPMAQLLLGESCTVTIAHSRTRDLPAVCRRADILIGAIGKPRFLAGDWIKPGATVIDVGINRIPAADGKSRLVGDVDFEIASQRAGAITPVPGGVGPMTIACLLANTLTAACRANGLPSPDWLEQPRRPE